MHRERGLFSPGWRKGALLTTLAITVGVPLLNMETTRRVIDAARGIPIDCSGGRNGSLFQTPYDVLAIADAGPPSWNQEAGTWLPNIQDRRRLNAGAYWYVDQVKTNQRPSVIGLLGGDKADQQYFQNQVAAYSGGTMQAPDSDFYLNPDAINTATSVRSFADMFFARGLHRAMLITEKSQAPRFAIISCAVDVPTSVLNAEDVIIQHDPEKEASIKKLLETDAAQNTENMESLKRSTLMYSPDGKLLTWLKKIKMFLGL